MNLQERRILKLEMIKKIRMDKGLTQKKLSEKSGVSLDTIKSYEIGRRNLKNAKYSTVIKLAKVLECEEGELIWVLI